jgi:hypothetical protein
VPRKAEGIGSESVGFNNLRTSLKVFVVDGANEIGLG